jgi:hypothetical protein
MTTEQLLSQLRDLLPVLRTRFHLVKLDIFGSYARGKQTPDSDIDVLAEFEPGYRNLFNLLDMKHWLEETFENDVDLVTPGCLREKIRDNVFGELRHVG